MFQLFSIFLTDILPIFAIAGAGYLLARRVAADVKTLSHVVFYAALPCLVFRLILASPIAGTDLRRIVLLAILTTLATGLLGYAITSVLGVDRPHQRAFLLVVMFSNAGNYGLPVVRFAYGPDALVYGSVIFLTGSILTYTLGAFVAAGADRGAWPALRKVGRMPALYGMIAALIVLAIGLAVPVPVMRPVTLLSDAALPLMMLVLGMQLARATRPRRPALVALAVAVSLLAAPVLSLGLSSALGVTGVARQAAVTLASMPVAVATTIVALEFDLAPEFVTSCVFVSTMLSPLTLTMLIAYLR